MESCFTALRADTDAGSAFRELGAKGHLMGREEGNSDTERRRMCLQAREGRAAIERRAGEGD